MAKQKSQQPTPTRSNRPIAEWRKNNCEAIRVALTKSSGRDIVGVRVWRPRLGRPDQSLKNGVNLPIKYLPDLAVAIKEAQKTAQKARLLDA
jgi:hypothetical protein